MKKDLQNSDIQVFVSHSSIDGQMARYLTTLLTTSLGLPASSIRCTSMPGSGLLPADKIETLNTDISTARVIIGIITKESRTNPNVLMELGAAWAHQKTIILVTPFGETSEEDVPALLRGSILSFANTEEAVNDMLKRIESECDIDPRYINTTAKIYASKEFLSSIRQITYQDRQDFLKFFFNDTTQQRAEIVFSTCSPSERAWHSQPTQCIDLHFPFPPPLSRVNTSGGGNEVPRAKGIRLVYPEVDANAAVEITKVLAAYNIDIKWVTDEIFASDHAHSPPDHCLIAIGLGFNNLTSRIQSIYKGLFEVTYGVDDIHKEITDDFHLLRNGELRHHSKPDQNQDYALLVRATRPDTAPRFIAAGRTAKGTAAATLFLSKKWKKIQELIMKSGSMDSTSIALTLRHSTSDLKDISIADSTFTSTSSQ